MKKQSSFIWFAAILFIVIFVVELINQRFWLNDFKVYYSAAQSLISGKEVYGQSFGLSTGFYKYSPFTLLCFFPYILFNFETASAMHFFVIGAATIFSILIVEKLLNQLGLLQVETKLNFISIVSIIIILNHLVRELHLGNVNMLIVLLLSACVYFESNSRYILAGIVFALALLIKPYLLILGLPLVLYKKYKLILSALFSTITCILVFTIFFGLSLSYQLHLNWLKAMMDHSSYLISAHTIISILNNLGFHFLKQNHQFYLIALFVLIYLLMYFIFIKRKEIPEQHNTNFSITFFIFLAIIPNLLITDTEHFLYALPVVIILLAYLTYLKNKTLITIFILIILAYGGNSSDLLGNQLSELVEKWGVLGIANFGMIILLIYIYINQNKLNRTSTRIEIP